MWKSGIWAVYEQKSHLKSYTDHFFCCDDSGEIWKKLKVGFNKKVQFYWNFKLDSGNFCCDENGEIWKNSKLDSTETCNFTYILSRILSLFSKCLKSASKTNWDMSKTKSWSCVLTSLEQGSNFCV